MNEPPVEELNSFPDDCLPLEDSYESREALFAAIYAWAAPRGYAFTTGRSARSTNQRCTVMYTCDKYRPPRSKTRIRPRNTTTRCTNCPFSINAKDVERYDQSGSN